jgi:hypothetical protein
LQANEMGPSISRIATTEPITQATSALPLLVKADTLASANSNRSPLWDRMASPSAVACTV